MKGLATMSFLGFLYLVIIIIFNETAGEPRGVQNQPDIGQPTDSGAQPEGSREDNGKNGTKNTTAVPTVNQAIFGHVATELLPSEKDFVVENPATNKTADPTEANRRQAPTGNLNNQTNPLADLFQIDDPEMRATLNAIYGAYRGNDQCTRKSFCQMGNYFKDMPGRDLIFLVMGNYIPIEYSLYYEIFKAAVVYGQNCNVYVCIPDPPRVDAASAALPGQAFTNSINAIPR